MKTIKKVLTALSIASIAVVLFGCLRITAEELYSLPRLTEQDLMLQRHISAVLDTGAEFSPPTGGPNRQAVQMKDLNGNGVDEVIAFFSLPEEGTQKIYIFQMVDGDYVIADIIEGVGTAIESIRYVDMDGDGIMELVIGWQMGAALQHMEIFSIRDFQHVRLARVEYAEIAVHDLTGNGNSDVVAIRLPTPDTVAIAEVFTLMPDQEILSFEARLSKGIDAITRVQTGMLTDGVSAVFIESEGRFNDGSIVTDICILQDGIFVNISMRMPEGISTFTVRDRMNSADIVRDGGIAVPVPRLLAAQSETEYYAIDWYGFDSSGHSRLVLTTFHNIFDEWYLILPFDWRDRVSVRREGAVQGERTVIFSYIAGDGGSFEDFLRIHRLTGDRGRQRANLPGRTAMRTEGASIYALELIAPPNSFGLTFDEDLIRANFRLVYADWLW
ncbi:MAG: VCBS repeat-containing protein [Oscillospiraceae bacterium]|nr:VCBS repeat-containing protein [Oscillospiraceae bacterium]